jgi:hypothetical protein
MKIITALLSAFLSIFSHGDAVAQAKPEKKTAVRSTMEVRTLLLQSKSSDLKISVASADEIWAVIMDEGLPDGSSFSIVSLSDGNASVYTSTGGGVIGGFAHENVARAARAFVSVMNARAHALKRVSIFPLPGQGQVTLYAIADSGVRSFSGAAVSLQQANHEMHAAYHAAHVVMSGLRQMSQGAR